MALITVFLDQPCKLAFIAGMPGSLRRKVVRKRMTVSSSRDPSGAGWRYCPALWKYSLFR